MAALRTALSLPPSSIFEQATQHPGRLFVDVKGLSQKVGGGLVVPGAPGSRSARMRSAIRSSLVSGKGVIGVGGKAGRHFLSGRFQPDDAGDIHRLASPGLAVTSFFLAAAPKDSLTALKARSFKIYLI